MSELKHQLMLNKDRSWVPCYLKSEADKAIAHHRYKRCLAMVRWCENAILGWMGHKESFSSHQRYVKVMLFTKWRERWLAIAKKFEEAK